MEASSRASVAVGATRRELLSHGARASLAGSAVLGLTASPAAALAGSSSSGPVPGPGSIPESDATRIHRLLSLELLLLYCYRHVLASPVLGGNQQLALAPLRDHEQAHIQALSVRLALLGGLIPAPPRSVAAANRDLAHREVPGRLGQLRGASDALSLLLSVERVTIGAYFVALIKLEDAGLIGLVAQIMANEAQHEAAIGELQNPGDGAAAVPYGLVQGVQ